MKVYPEHLKQDGAYESQSFSAIEWALDNKQHFGMLHKVLQRFMINKKQNVYKHMKKELQQQNKEKMKECFSPKINANSKRIEEKSRGESSSVDRT